MTVAALVTLLPVRLIELIVAGVFKKYAHPSIKISCQAAGYPYLVYIVEARNSREIIIGLTANDQLTYGVCNCHAPHKACNRNRSAGREDALVQVGLEINKLKIAAAAFFDGKKVQFGC